MNLEDNEIKKLIKAIELIQAQIKWKPNKAEIHLAKRIKLRHLVDNSSLDDYEKIIKAIIFNPESKVYIFQDDDSFYPTITDQIKNQLWLVMFSVNGIMETAFPPSNAEKYLKINPFIYVGKLKEIV